MLERRELEEARDSPSEIRLELERLRMELMVARTRHERWRKVLERHLEKGCPSRTLFELLAEKE